MKEIDFLPSWYKKNRRQISGYKWQYGVIIGCFAFMVCWSFISGKVVSSSSAIDQHQGKAESNTLLEYEKYKVELEKLNKQKNTIDKCLTKMSVANIIAELSHIVGDNVVLSRVEINAKEFESKNKNYRSSSVIRSSNRDDKTEYENNVIYTIILKGVSTDNNSAAQLICDLEDSSYFSKVILGYSKNIQQKNKQMSEFEISCYLANFKEVVK